MKKKAIWLVGIILILVVIGMLLIPKKSDNTTHLIRKQPETVMELLLTKKTGIYVFGFDTCPWCQELYPVLDDVLKNKKQEAWQVDTHGKNFTDKNKGDLKQYIVDNTSYDGVVVPMIIFISDDGFTQYHVGTLDDHDATKETMSKNQQRYLKELLQNMLTIYEQHNDKK